jgi:hypothetical protein
MVSWWSRGGFWALRLSLRAYSTGPPTPLCPDPGRQLAPHEIATLHGDVRDVDV